VIIQHSIFAPMQVAGNCLRPFHLSSHSHYPP